MKRSHQVVLLGTALIVAITASIIIAADHADTPANKATTTSGPTLTVSVVSPQLALLPAILSASGNISAWQEASIGNETNGLKLEQVLVNVGDSVKHGQLLARFNADTVQADLAHTLAAEAEAEALLAEASADVKRTAELQASGALSAQQIQQYITAEKAARARLQSARALVHIQQLRVEHTQVYSPDDGIISARAATVGAVMPAGQELFRLIRGSRLEWRAEVAAADLAKLEPGQHVHITPLGGGSIIGTVRIVAPVVDIQSRNGTVYVDLPSGSNTKAGSFARGWFELGTSKVLTLPQSAIQLRDGFSYVMRAGPDGRVRQTKVSTGRRTADLVEITNGITPADQVVATGGAFLGDGDLVKVVPHQLTTQLPVKPIMTGPTLTASSGEAM